MQLLSNNASNKLRLTQIKSCMWIKAYSLGFSTRCLSFSHLWHSVLTVAWTVGSTSKGLQQLDLKSCLFPSCKQHENAVIISSY